MCNTGLLHNKRNPGGLVLSSIFGCERNCTIDDLKSQACAHSISETLNDPETVENAGQAGFFGFTKNSSQTVATPRPLMERAIQGIMKKWRQTYVYQATFYTYCGGLFIVPYFPNV